MGPPTPLSSVTCSEICLLMRWRCGPVFACVLGSSLLCFHAPGCHSARLALGCQSSFRFGLFSLRSVAGCAFGLSLLTQHHPPWITVATFDCPSLSQRHPDGIHPLSPQSPVRRRLMAVLVQLWERFFGRSIPGLELGGCRISASFGVRAGAGLLAGVAAPAHVCQSLAFRSFLLLTSGAVSSGSLLFLLGNLHHRSAFRKCRFGQVTAT